MSEPWGIIKNGMFFRTGAAGYTSSVYEAGHFTKDDALLYATQEGVTASPLGNYLDKQPERIRFEEPIITADAVKAYREDTGAGMHEAKHELRRRAMGKAFSDFRRRANLRDKVEFILDWIEEKETS